MATRPAAPGRAHAVVAGDGDAFADVLARVRQAGRGGAPVDLVVARESGLLLTAGEFRALRDAIDRDRLAVTLRCDDALRDGLARAMGIERRRIPPEMRPLLARAAAGPRQASAGVPQGHRPGAGPDPHQAFRPAPRPAAAAGGVRPDDSAVAGTAGAGTLGGATSGPAPGAAGGTGAATEAGAGAVGDAGAVAGAGAIGGAGAAAGTGAGAGTGVVPEAGGVGDAGRIAGVGLAGRSGVGAGANAVGGAGAMHRAPTGARVAAAPGPDPAPNAARSASAGRGSPGGARSAKAESSASVSDSNGDAAKAAAAPTAGGSWPERPGPPPPPPAPQRATPGRRFRRRRDGGQAAGTASGVGPAAGPDGPGGAGEPPGGRGGTDGPSGPFAPRPAPFEPIDEEPTGPTFDQIVAPRYRGRRRPRWLGFALAALVLVALGALAAALLMPRATVALTLKTAPVAGEAILDVTASGQPLDGGATMAVAATPIEVEVAFSGSVPVSGTRAEPDATAAGTVRFANPAAEPVVVPAGTVLTTGGGVAFLTDAEVTVPGADPATGQAGQAEGAIRAAEPGTGGNVEVGEIGGRLPSGVYYSNREEATAGGTDRQIPVVAAADLDALRAQADAALVEEATKAAQGKLGDGVEVLPGSVAVVASDEAFSAEEGAEAETVSLEATRTVRALAWSPAEALAQARNLLAAAPPAALAQQVPAGYVLDPATVSFGAPQPGEGRADGTRLRLPVEAVATPPFGPSERRALAERLAGLDEAAAAAVLAQEPAFTAARLEFAPGWLPHRMPADPGRIEIAVEP